MPINDATPYLPLLKKIAKGRHRKLVNAGIQSIEAKDLEHIGYMGLNDAMQTFDSGKGMSFEKFARYKIKYAISEFLRKQDLVDHRIRKEIKKMREAEEHLVQILGAQPSEMQLVEALGWSLEKLHKIIRKSLLIVDALETNGEAETEAAQFNAFFKKRLAADTNDCLQDLDDRERLFLLLKDLQGFSVEEIVLMTEIAKADQVYFRLKKGRRQMKNCLETKGYEVEDIFSSL